MQSFTAKNCQISDICFARKLRNINPTWMKTSPFLRLVVRTLQRCIESAVCSPVRTDQTTRLWTTVDVTRYCLCVFVWFVTRQSPKIKTSACIANSRRKTRPSHHSNVNRLTACHTFYSVMPNVPPSDQMRATGSGRRKVALPPGRSQFDWIRNSAKLRPPPQRTVTIQELRQHKSRNDAWLAIAGNVFDVTPYIEYHPGGIDMILLGAGKDATVLFNKYHAWVNPDFMLARCFIGTLETSDGASDSNSPASNDVSESQNPESPNPERPSLESNCRS